MKGGWKLMAQILVIEDHDEVRHLVKEMLTRVGHKVEDAPNGAVALRMLEELPADLIITDIFMPEKEGVETIREVKKRFPEIRILAMSGGVGVMDSSYALRLAKGFGADRTLPKPITRSQLLAAVDSLLNPE
jgi:CheY-like chemotaxis protein